MIYKLIHWEGNSAGSFDDLNPQEAVDKCIDIMRDYPNAGILLIEIGGSEDGNDLQIPVIGDNSSPLAKQVATDFLNQIFPVVDRE